MNSDLSTAESRFPKRSDSWKRRRVRLLKQACAAVAQRVASGMQTGLAIREVAPLYRDLSLGKGHKLSLSEKSLQRHYYRPRKRPCLRFKIERLPTAQRERVHEMLLQNRTYREIRDTLKAEFGVLISISAIGNYYSSSGLKFPGAPSNQNMGGSPNELPSATNIHLHFDVHLPGKAGLRL